MKISTKPAPMPHATLIYSPPGVGKTELAAYYPAPIFLMVDLEIGLLTLINSGRVPPETAYNTEQIVTWDKLIDNLEFLTETRHPYKTVVIDTLNSAELLLKRKITYEHYFNREDKFDAYGKGWDRCINPWNYFLHRLQNLKLAGLRPVLLAHSEVSQIRNPDGEDYQSHTPLLNKTKLWVPTNAFCDNVFFMNLEVCTVTDKVQQAMKDKDHRLLYTQADAGHFAKNRLSLKAPVSMGRCGADGFANLEKAIAAAHPEPGTTRPRGEPAKKANEEAAPKPGPEQGKPAKGEAATKASAPAPSAEAQPPASTGKPWVDTWLNRIAAETKIGPALSLFSKIAKDYSDSAEPDQVEDFPKIFAAWARRCLEIDPKAVEQIKKKLAGEASLRREIIDAVSSALESATVK